MTNGFRFVFGLAGMCVCVFALYGALTMVVNAILWLVGA